MKTLIIAEHNNQQLFDSTLNLVNAGTQLGHPIDVIVIGDQCHQVAEQAQQIEGVSHVICADNPAYQYQLAENSTALIHSIIDGYSHVIAAASTTGKSIMPRVAALSDCEQISEITAIIDPQIFQRPIYAGNAFETVKNTSPIQCITVRTSAFEAASLGNQASLSELDSVFTSDSSQFIKQELSVSERPELTAAKTIITGGRAFASKENFALIEPVADKLNAAIGASRAAVDAGYAPNDLQVGQTGKIVAPDLYIAIGVSGAIQHLAGMKESKVIVAINKDPDAPIFDIADYGLVADLFDVIPELEQSLA